MREKEPSSQPAFIVLAAGKGTRMKSSLPKVLHEVAGRPMLDHCLEAAAGLSPSRVVVVLGHEADRVKTHLASWRDRFHKLTTVLQVPQLGTGHAVAKGMSGLKGHKGPVVVLYGDVPLVQSKTLARLVSTWRKKQAALVFATMHLDNPGSYGRVLRKGGTVQRIVEAADSSAEQADICEVNSGLYCFDTKFLRESLRHLASDNEQGEFYLTDTVELAVRLRKTVATITMNPQEALGINNRRDQAEAVRVLNRQIVGRLMDQGVTILFPESVVIEPGVRVGRDTVIGFGVHLLGQTRLGTNCRIETGAVIRDSRLAPGSWVKPYSVITESVLGPDVQVGPFAHLRPGTTIAKAGKVGNFVETKKASLGPGVKANHLSYLGDVEIGEGTNVGAGTITCNYDGRHKHKTKVGKRVFIGSDTQLVAPVTVGDDVIIGAGTTVLKDVEPGVTLVNPKGQRHLPTKKKNRKKR